MTIHHEFSPSSLKRRELCPGSYKLEKDLPSFDSDDATEGTMLHALIADAIQKAYIDKDPSFTSDSITDERVKSSFDYVSMLLEKEKENSSNVEVYVEVKLSYTYCGIEQFFGFLDVLFVCDDKVIVIDHKYGHREVDSAEENSQGATYALMAMQKFKKEVTEVHFFNPVIKQTTSATFTDRQKIANYLMGVIVKAQKEDAPVIPSEDACRYCKAMYHGTCPAVAKTAEIAVMDAEKVVPLPALSVLPVEDLCQMKDRCDFIAKLAERVDAEIKRRCENDGSCGEWMIKESSGGREIKDITGAFAASGMESKDYLSCCTASVSKLEKLFAKQGKEAGTFKTEKEGKEVFNEKLFDFISAKPNKKSLVRGK